MKILLYTFNLESVTLSLLRFVFVFVLFVYDIHHSHYDLSYRLMCLNNFILFFQIAEGVKPTLAELEKFEDQPDGVDVECILNINSKMLFLLGNFASKPF